METRKPKVFIVGISGFLGYNLAIRLKKNFLISGACFRYPVIIPNAQIYQVDPNKPEILEPLIRVYDPDFIVNASGVSDPKTLEENPKYADSVNSVLAVSVAASASKIRAQLIHLSCNRVYDGADGNYKEDDLDFTMNDELGKQKIAAESFIRSQMLESTVLRLGKVLGLGHPHRITEFDRLRIAICEKKKIEASQLKKQSYLSVDSLARAVDLVLRGAFPGKHRIFNIGGLNSNEVDLYQSWFQVMGMDSKYVRPLSEETKRDLSIDCTAFQTSFPEWKAETKESLFSNLLKELIKGDISPQALHRKIEKISS